MDSLRMYDEQLLLGLFGNFTLDCCCMTFGTMYLHRISTAYNCVQGRMCGMFLVSVCPNKDKECVFFMF